MKKAVQLIMIFLAFGQMVNAAGWVQKASLPGTARVMAVGFSIGAKGYMGTGWDTAQMPHLQGDFWEYDTLTNAWTQKADFGGTPRYGAVGFTIGNKGYIGTGYDFVVANSDLWEYDPTANTWTSRASMPAGGRYTATGFSIGTKGYIGTGTDGNVYLNDLWEYNQTTDTWTQRANFPGLPRNVATGLSINGKGYIGLGGFDDFWEYNPVTDTWTQKANYGGITRDGASSFTIGGYGYIGTGSSSALSMVLHDFWQYDPTSNVWTQEADFIGTDRDGGVGFSIGPNGYIGFGSPGNNPQYAFSDFFKYTPSCSNPVITGASANVYTICQNSSSNLTATGNLNSALNWYWYTGSCGGTLVNTGTSILVSPTITTRYYVRGEGGCAIATFCDSVTIVVNPAPTPTITPNGPTTFCQGGSVILNVGTFSSYVWSNASTNQSTNVNASGTYTVTVSDNHNCTNTASQVVTVNSLPTPSIIGGSSVCSGGSLTLDAGLYSSYLWSNATTTRTISVNTAGTFTVTVTDNHGCTATASQIVTLNALVNPVITGNSSFCAGGSTILTTGIFSSYNWSNGATTQSITVNTGNTYRVTVTDGQGCTGTTSRIVTINPNPAPTISANGPTTFCAGSSVTLDAGAYSSYVWSNAATTRTIVVNTQGTFIVTVTDGNGCTGVASQATIVHSNPSPSIIPSGPTTFCAGGAVVLSSLVFPHYSWSNSSTTQSIIATTSNTYVLTVTDVNGCTGTASQIVTANPNPTPAITGGNTLCSGGSLVLDAGHYTTYHWSTGSINQTISVVISGTYTITVTDINGCTGTSSQTVTVGNTPVPVITGGTIFCQGGSLNLSVGSFTTYLWSNGASTQTINVNSPGIYRVTVTNASGCSGTDTIPVTVSSNPVPSISGGNSFCIGGSLTLSGGSFTQYHWSDGDITQLTTIFTPGTYYLTVTNINGCTGTTSTVITTLQSPAPVITPSGATSFCNGDSVTLNAGASYTSYHWSTLASTQSITVHNSATYFVTVTNANGCTGTSSIVVNVIANPTPTISPNGNISLCDGQTVMLLSSNGILYSWSTGETTQGITVSQTGNYTVTVSYGANCSSSSIISHVVVHPIPVATITSSTLDPVLCSGDSLILTTNSATTPLTYSWNTSATTQSIWVHTAGSFVVLVTDTNHCHSTSSINVASYLNPVASFTSSTFVNTTTFTNTSTNSSNYFWYFGDGSVSNQMNPVHNYATLGTYTVKLVVTNPCGKDSVIHTITLTGINEISAADMGFKVYPNPASDRLNVVFTASSEKAYTIQLMDVMGREVWTAKRMTAVGENQIQVNLSDVPAGVYMVALKLGDASVMTKIIIQ